MDLAYLSSGNYLVKVYTVDNTKTLRIVKK
ncbi:MAG: T9SS type A sorting domain-containing protein [Flavobacterium sp.]|nr:T9SS type A sorting domain-containing protein [Flavobacterium sp.]